MYLPSTSSNEISGVVTPKKDNSKVGYMYLKVNKATQQTVHWVIDLAE